MKYIWLLIALFLYSCGEKPAQDKGVSSLLGEAEQEIFQQTGLPLAKEPITLDAMVWTRTLSGPWGQMPVWQEISKTTGVDFKWIEIPAEAWAQRKNLTLASGDIPDIIMGFMDKNADINVYGPQGAFLELDDYIENYMPNLKRIYQERPYYKKLGKAIDGHWYSLPSINELEQRKTPDDWFINKTWLKNLGLSIPKTTEELYQVLKAFKTQDPNGNGKADEIPLSSLGLNMDNIYGLNSLFGSFGWPLEQNGLSVKDGKIFFIPTTEGFKEATKFIKKLYTEKLLDAEAFTQDRSIYFSKGKENPEILGAFIYWHDDTVLGYDRANADYTVLPPLIGPKGQKPKWRNNLGSQANVVSAVISAKNPYPATTARLFDYLYEPDTSWQLCYGPFNLTIKRHDDDTITTLAVPEDLTFDEYRFKKAPGLDSVPGALTREMWKKFPGSISIQRKAVRHQVYKPFLLGEANYVPEELNFSLEDKNEANSISADLKDYVSQTAVNWITGVSDINQDWDSFIKQLDRIGLQRFLEIGQKAYDDFNS